MADPLELEDFYDLRRIRDVAVSPIGDRVAFVVAESDPDANETRRSLFVAPTDGSRKPHRLTRASDAGLPAWGPTGERLAFLASRDRDVALEVGRSDESGDESEVDEDGEESRGSDGDEEPKPQVWLFDLALGGDARQVTEFDEGVREFDWSPEGDRVVVAARDPTEEQREYLDDRRDGGPVEITRLQHKRDGMGFLDDVRSYLFVVDVATRESRRLDDAYARGAMSTGGLHPAWGADDRIAFRSYRGEKPDHTFEQDLYTVAPDGGNLRRLTDGGVGVSNPRWNAAGERLAFDGANPTNTYHPTEVYVVRDAEDSEPRSISASLDRTRARSGAPEWVSDDELLAPVGDEALTRLVRLDAERDDPERAFEKQGIDRTVTRFSVGGDRAVVCLSHPSEGADLYALDTADLDGSDPLRLTRLNDDLLADAALPTCERVHYENGDGIEVEGLAYLPDGFDPEGESEESRPLIAHIHGGPTAYDAPGFSFDYSYWTGRGYVVFNVNYRGSTSYGRAFSESIRGEWGPREADDIVSGVEELVERGWADADRLFVSGFSQGGINTAYVVTRTDMFAAAAPEHGIYDFYSLFGTADLHQWYVHDIGLPWEKSEAYRAISSIHDVDEIDTPLLVTAGGEDWRCPPSQAEQLYVSVRRRGVDAKLVVYPDEHHNVGAPERATHRLRELTEWFESHDPGRDDGDGVKKGDA
ncbi:S9 family peptidase [Haloprofundus salilacus]|uniref:S9 family peptidase n=1 Tax=Haloprofundus salilacus TaxID=2876190 RepID=UPI001CCEE016|nr:S9 family peptidase [Haloprofundus salilacus]